MRPDCAECGKPSEHDHHVVPKSMGGTTTVPLCTDCHSKVHGKAMAASSLTRLGIMRKFDAEECCMVFHHWCDGYSMEEIAGIYDEAEMPPVKDRASYIRGKLKRMRSIPTSSLLDLFEPILRYDSENYNREFYTLAWEGNQ